MHCPQMTTAATKAQLLESLGYEYFVDELQAESELELSWTYYCNNKAPETEQEAIKRRGMCWAPSNAVSMGC